MLSKLQLRNFRCFEALTIEFCPTFNFIIGPNGEGKSSILEGACALLRLQSPRVARLAPLVRVGCKSFHLHGVFDNHTLDFQFGGLRRRLQFDGVDQRTGNDYLRIGRVVSFANLDIEIVRGSSEPRRRYLDFLGTQIEARYRPALRAFERALRARNTLLKSPQPRARELAAYDQPLITHGLELSRLRSQLVGRVAPFVQQAYAAISRGRERIDIYFAPGNSDDFAMDLAKSRPEEMRLRQTIVGPHRDDLELFVDGMDAQIFASEGQQRTLALALKIGQARLFAEEGASPLLLLDDIFGELDTDRRNELLASLPADSQKLVTATSLNWRAGDFAGRQFTLIDRVLKAA